MGGGGEVWIVKVLNFVQVVLVSGDDQLQTVLWEELLISRATTNVVSSLLKVVIYLCLCPFLCLWGTS